MEAVKTAAKTYDFDVYHVPGKYFVLCDWYLDLVKMFDDNHSSYSEALEWMQVEKGSMQLEMRSIEGLH